MQNRSKTNTYWRSQRTLQSITQKGFRKTRHRHVHNSASFLSFKCIRRKKNYHSARSRKGRASSGFWTLNLYKYRSFAALDAIDMFSYISMNRNGTFTPSPHTQMQIHGHSINEKEGPNSFLPYEQEGRMVNTAKKQKKLDDRATQASHLRFVGKNNYQFHKKKHATSRQSEKENLCLQSMKQQKWKGNKANM